MARQQSKSFTEKELEIMQIFWEREEATVRDVQEALLPARPYTSVLTIVRVLERKGHITHRQEGRGFVYRPVATPDESKSKVLAHVVEDVFGGSSESVVLSLVETGNLTLEELDRIRHKLRRRTQ
jgi:BlaI family transcriptional regulator, penicillinase repressor